MMFGLLETKGTDNKWYYVSYVRVLLSITVWRDTLVVSELKHWLDRWIAIHQQLVVDYFVVSASLGWLFVGRTVPLDFDSSEVLLVDLYQQFSLRAEVHRVVFAFLFAHNVFDFHFGILLDK